MIRQRPVATAVQFKIRRFLTFCKQPANAWYFVPHLSAALGPSLTLCAMDQREPAAGYVTAGQSPGWTTVPIIFEKSKKSDLCFASSSNFHEFSGAPSLVCD